MKAVFKSLLAASVVFSLAACSSTTSSWKRISDGEIDQKSYAVAYAGTAQTYEDRVNESYDIDAYIRGVDDYFNNKNTLPIEQIRGSLLNRMLDHDVYAYYSGVLDAASFQSKANYLSPKCWSLVHKPSVTQGIQDAMLDLKQGKVRTGDAYIQKGAEDLLHECVEKVEDDQKNKQAQKKSAKKKRVKK